AGFPAAAAARRPGPAIAAGRLSSAGAAAGADPGVLGVPPFALATEPVTSGKLAGGLAAPATPELATGLGANNWGPGTGAGADWAVPASAPRLAEGAVAAFAGSRAEGVAISAV